MNVTPEQILQVADDHMRMFSRRVAFARAGRKGYNLEECEHYLSIWTSITEKGAQDLTEEENDEIRDAYESGSGRTSGEIHKTNPRTKCNGDFGIWVPSQS